MSRLIVIAHPLEAVAFQGIEDELLITGFGKVNAALGLTRRLVNGPSVEEVLVFGTAGRLDGALSLDSVYELKGAIEYDAFETPRYSLPSEKSAYPSAFIATGSAFLEDPNVGAELASAGVGLVDMESSVYIHVAQELEVPIRIFKVISDDADEEAGALWDTVAARLSDRLFAAYEELVSSSKRLVG